ncbi:hypothetical protein BIY23_02875 [Wolbachia pipientis]|uniref:Lipoprotein n=1 Tax=Wolbachia pipientis TaxID=955 RepID=A0A1E7QJG5_WOLPI|nr:hypothetical protein [Wolbachia pipientis]OEY86621.1 hypothetical protein BIY23_02875 [Wolbachia pipientis]
MNDNQKNYIAWFVIILLAFSCNFLKINNQNDTKALFDKIEILIKNNQVKLERKIAEFRRSLPTEPKEIKCKNLAKSLLLIVQMNNKLLNDVKFSDFRNYVNEIKLLTLECDSTEIENALHILENIEEIDTLNEVKLSFEHAIDRVHNNEYSLFKKIVSNWIKIHHKNDSMRTQWIEIEKLINIGNWQDVDIIIKNFTNPEFKPWVRKICNLIIVLENISIVYNSLLQYIP